MSKFKVGDIINYRMTHNYEVLKINQKSNRISKLKNVISGGIFNSDGWPDDIFELVKPKKKKKFV